MFVGKERGRQALTQDEINKLLVERASAGDSVVRLKGGDPFVFGRGGEEAQVLARHSIPFEVVPGITSAIAAAAYAGIPVTQRRVATCFTVVSGSEDPTKPESSIPWDVLARTGGTLVVLMGWAALKAILETLQREGMAPDTPVSPGAVGHLEEAADRGRHFVRRSGKGPGCWPDPAGRCCHRPGSRPARGTCAGSTGSLSLERRS